MGGWVDGRMGRWVVYETYKKTKKEKLRCLLLRRTKIFLYIFMKSLHGEKNKKALIYTTTVAVISL